MTDSPHDARKAILARRAKFLAAALAATMPACDREKEGITADHPAKTEHVDSSPPPPPPPPPKHDAAVAMPCLEVMPPPTGGDAGPIPRPCLKIAMPRDAGPPPAPHPCLKMPMKDDDL